MASTDPTALGRTSYEQVHGYTPDITLYTRHDWCGMIFWFCSLTNTQCIGMYLGACGKLFGSGDYHFILDKTGKVHATNSTRAIQEEHWKNPDAVRQIEDFNESILVKIGDDVKPEDAYFDDEYPDLPSSLFENDEATQEVTTAEEGASIPDIDDHLVENVLQVKPEQNPEERRKKRSKGQKNPRWPTKKQPIDSRPRGLEEVEEPAPVLEQEEEFVTDGDMYDGYLNNQVMLKTGDRRLKCVAVNRTHDLKNVQIGQRNNNPLLDTKC